VSLTTTAQVDEILQVRKLIEPGLLVVVNEVIPIHNDVFFLGWS
jgi:hypothetical protein